MHCDTPNFWGRRSVVKAPVLTVLRSITISSPGSTSRTYSALHRSRAQVSLATTYPSPPSGPPLGILPMHRGRKPFGSRTATRLVSVIITHEKAPSAWVIASKIWSSWDLLLLCEMRCRKSSESTVLCRRTPCCSKKDLSSWKLDRLPLCASARFPMRYRTQKGWNPSSCVFPPAVEYRVCPIADVPGRDAMSSGVNMSVTRPRPR
mmetsp:Transcript_5665/g.13104  ORF Transcript_5665/g.13104 Transcript_5665/m.13104 type:complete len:206 (-) Transcript_5665:154-771(-)